MADVSENMEDTVTFFYCHFLQKHCSEAALHCRCLHICQHISELGSCYFELIFQPKANYFSFVKQHGEKKRLFSVILLFLLFCCPTFIYSSRDFGPKLLKKWSEQLRYMQAS